MFIYMRKLLILLCLIIVYDFISSPIRRYFLTQTYYKKGLKLAKEKGKKLMVIGDPCSGNVFTFIRKIFPNCLHGDCTIDLFGCNKCDRIDINNINSLRQYKTDDYVIVETGTLSFAQNIKATFDEIKRISGGDFLSSGGTTSIYWQYIGNKIYSSNYPNSIKYMIYPFDMTNTAQDYKVYNLETNEI
jgi:hypothetical protein